MSEDPQVVIVGAGFGGLWAARALIDKPVQVLLLDRDNYHAFWPLLYQVAAAELDAEQIAYPVRRILRNASNVKFLMGNVSAVDLDARQVQTSKETVDYDYLILALGSVPAFFNIPGAAQHTFPLKTIEHGMALRNQILRCFEEAVQEPDAARRQQLLTFVIVGGGPTGVEFAGALAELVNGPLCKDFRGINIQDVRIVLVEMLDTLLAAMPERLGTYADRELREKGVDVRLNTAVSEVGADCVTLKNGEQLASDTIIWTAGVGGAPEATAWNLPTVRDGRVEVRQTLQAPGQDHVYVIGDMAAFPSGDDGDYLPLLAPVAMQQGEHAAANILRQRQGEAPLPFHYRDKGTLATVGRNSAVAHIFNRAFTGFGAWLLWLVVHLVQLIGFRNRLVVLINWAWSYVFFERMVRLVLPSERDLHEATKARKVNEQQ